MACEVVCCPGAVFALWGQPTIEDISRVHQELIRGTRLLGRPVVYIARVPADAPAPDLKVRQHLRTHLQLMTQSCSSYHVIMEGDGFVAALKRGVLTSLLQPVWKKKVFYVHAHPTDVEASLTGLERSAAAQVLKSAELQGHLSCAAPSSGRSPSAASA
jgi:hypothetical protein